MLQSGVTTLADTLSEVELLSGVCKSPIQAGGVSGGSGV